MRKKCLLTVRGPIQFVTGLNALEWYVKQVQGTSEFDYYLLLYAFGGQGDTLYNIVYKMAQIRKWKKIYVMNDKITYRIMHLKRIKASMHEFKDFINEDYFDQVYLEYNLGYIDKIIMNTYSQSHLIIYGDQFGLVTDEKSYNKTGGSVGYNTYTVLGNKLRYLARKIILGSLPKRNFDLAVLALPVDGTGYLLNQIPLIIPTKQHILNIIKQVHEQMPDFQEYCMSFIKEQTKDVRLYLLCNFCELQMMARSDEIKMYEQMIRYYSQAGSLVLLKPHPRTSSDFLQELVQLLENDYEVKIISDENFGRLPIELWQHLIKSCKIINVFSSSMLSIAYLYDRKVVFALNVQYIKKFFFKPTQNYMIKQCRLYNELLRRLETWDGRSCLWKRELGRKTHVELIKPNSFLWKALMKLSVFYMRCVKVKNYHVYRGRLEGKCGLEIGGPSHIFQDNNILPIYLIASHLDGCNFSEKTVWEGNIKEGLTYAYHKKSKKGYQFICDAVDLTAIASGSYDFIIASHVIEHIANPIKALQEWLRVLKDTGILLLVVPCRDSAFDHNRPVTTLKHLIDDFKNNVKEDDLAHLSEILELHDLALDPPAGSYETFKKRSEENYNNRCLHHHVFDRSLVVEIFDNLGLQILAVDAVLPDHIIVMGKKVARNEKTNNDKFLDGNVCLK